MVPEPLVELRDLCVRFATEDGLVCAVDGVSLDLSPGETLGVVGESGSGKSVSWLTVMGLETGGNVQTEGRVLLEGKDILGAPDEQMRSIRGIRISMIFQDPMTSLNPFYKVGVQIAEAILAHHPEIGKAEAGTRAVEMLRAVKIPQPEDRANQYPHEFSGGMRQRAMIAMALALDPDVLIADEPTTALDVTVQAQILDLIAGLQEQRNMAVVLITHDLGVVAEYCDRIAVMYAGKVVEEGPADDIYYHAEHPYTWGLLRSIPRLDEAAGARLTPITGLPPSLISVPSGCAFHPRCPYVMDVCRTQMPELLPSDGHHASACHLSLEEKRRIFRDEIAAKP